MRRWKLVLPHTYRTLAGRPGGKGGIPAKYENEKNPVPKLYELRADLAETNEVAAQHPEEVARLLAFAEKCRDELGDSLTGKTGRGTRQPATFCACRSRAMAARRSGIRRQRGARDFRLGGEQRRPLGLSRPPRLGSLDVFDIAARRGDAAAFRSICACAFRGRGRWRARSAPRSDVLIFCTDSRHLDRSAARPGLFRASRQPPDPTIHYGTLAGCRR